jgi:hypothetical protein
MHALSDSKEKNMLAKKQDFLQGLYCYHETKLVGVYWTFKMNILIHKTGLK